MIPDYIVKFMQIAYKNDCKSFINQCNEMIVEPKNNIYFQLSDVKSELDVKCKVISWLSRHSCKGVSELWQKRIRGLVNEYLGTNFSKDEMIIIYGKYGMKYDYTEIIKFIKSGYDMSLIKAGESSE